VLSKYKDNFVLLRFVLSDNYEKPEIMSLCLINTSRVFLEI